MWKVRRRRISSHAPTAVASLAARGSAEGGRRRVGGAGSGPRSFALALLGALLGLASAALPAGATAAAGIETEPALVPDFSNRVSDYAVDCSGGPLSVKAATTRGTRVGIDGARPRDGRFERSVRLRPGQRFEIATAGRSGRRTHHIRCLPEDFPEYEFTRDGPPARSLYALTPGFFTSPEQTAYAVVFDDRGAPVWWFGGEDSSVPNDLRLLSDGTAAFTYLPLPGRGGTLAYEIRALDGERLRRVRTKGSPTDGHDLLELGGGRFLLMTYRVREGVDLSPYGGPADAPILDSEIQRINRKGEVAWSWSSRDHVGLEETERWWDRVLIAPVVREGVGDTYDATHINSFERDGDDLIISLRHTDAVYKISGRDGRVVWKLGGTPTAESLEVIGDPESPDIFGGQHDARLLKPGVVSVHDNGTQRGYAPRALRFKIDEEAGTARLRKQRTDPDVGFSGCCGSARWIDGGSLLVGFGGTRYATEYDSAGGRTFRLATPGLFSYRAVPVEPGFVSDPELRAGMDAISPRRPPECDGKPAAGPAGTPGADRLRGNARPEFIRGLAGADGIRGRGGSDCLIGDSGGDRIAGGEGGDLILGLRGADRLRGRDGRDELRGGRGDDLIAGGPGRDTIDCGDGYDTVITDGLDRIAADCERRRRA